MAPTSIPTIPQPIDAKENQRATLSLYSIRRVSIRSLMFFVALGGVIFEREERESLGVLEIALSAGEEEQQQRPRNQGQADEHLQGQDLQSGLLEERENVVARMVVS